MSMFIGIVYDQEVRDILKIKVKSTPHRDSAVLNKRPALRGSEAGLIFYSDISSVRYKYMQIYLETVLAPTAIKNRLT